MKLHLLIFCASLGCLMGQLAAAQSPLRQAKALFEDKNWAEARAAYDQVRKSEADWHSETARQAVEGAVACSVKLQQWDDAIARGEEFINQTRDSYEEALGQRFLAGLYLTFPHNGIKQGGRFLRGESGQGVYVYSWKKDRKDSVRHFERARELLISLSEKPASPERLKLLKSTLFGVNFDLVSTLVQQEGFGQYWGWWWNGSFGEEEDSTAVEDADYEEPRGYTGWYGQNQEPPTGIPLGPDGQPHFLTTPSAYSSHLADGEKVRYLLEEIQRLDNLGNQDDAARALFRRAMITRTLYGPETVAIWKSFQMQRDRFGHVLPSDKDEQKPEPNIWDLADDQALTIVGGRLQLLDLTPAESPLALLREVQSKYPQCNLQAETQYSIGLFYQTRQQYAKAIAEYDKLIKRFPSSPRVADAKAQLTRIRQPAVILDMAGVNLPGRPIDLAFTFRNTHKIEFTASRFDIARCVEDRLNERGREYWNYRNMFAELFQNKEWKKYVGGSVATWSEQDARETVDYLPLDRKTRAPLTEPGGYLIEARVEGGAEVARVIVMVSDVAIVQKALAANATGLIYVCDAITGQPLSDQKVRVYEHWQEYVKGKGSTHQESVNLTTNSDGVIEYRQKHGSQIDAMVNDGKGHMAFSFFQQWSGNNPDAYWENGPRYYVVTDRPVYRSGDTVKYSIWKRQLEKRAYLLPPKEDTITVEVWDAKNSRAQSVYLKADENGMVNGEFKLGSEPPLGVYRIVTDSRQPDARQNGGGLFRVEEYKKPEFEVTVKPSTTQARLGEKFQAKIEARYYFGAPVTQGKVSYKVFRENYQHVYFGPGEYDWLYGQGYGRNYYPYPWFPWWGRWGGFICWEGPWPYEGFRSYGFPWGSYGGDDEDWRSRLENGGTRKALRELVAQGTADLKADGTCEVEIDTARARAEQGDHDHRYTIETEVRDASRRTIEGKGSVIASRQEFYAFVETNNGWYQPLSDAQVEVRTLTPDNLPVAAKGEVVVSRIRYHEGANADQPVEEEVKRWLAETDSNGRLSFRYPIPGEGQYRIAFRTKDSWKEEVLGNSVFWVAGPKFDGRIYRFNNLEIIADKRSYQVGDIAHLLVNVAQNNSRILFSDNVSRGSMIDYRFIDLPNRSTVIDIPIEARHMPNFFVEATLVRDGRVQTESRELFVPPKRELLDVSIHTDKEIYKPGDKGTVQVEVRDSDGKPVAGDVTLTAYDEAITYIQNEFGPNPKTFFHGQKRYHFPYVNMSTEQVFNPQGSINRPESEIYTKTALPEGWQTGGGIITVSGLAWRGNGAVGGEVDSLKGFSAFGSSEISVSAGFTSSWSTADGVSMGDLGMVGGLFKKDADGGSPGPDLIEPEIRSNFADTALWLPTLRLDENGRAQAEIQFPQSLTTWRLHGYALTASTQVGDTVSKVTTTKNLIVRLESPRFFVERDEAVLSANVHNYLKTAQSVKAELIVPARQFVYNGAQGGEYMADKDGNYHFMAEANVDANGEHRFDWPVKVLQAGLARITVKALTSEESDAMQMAFPVVVHGIRKAIAQSGSYRLSDEGARTLNVDLPAEIDPEQSQLDITLSPSLAGVMIDALPYLADYPYGCVEQTMSRFYPSVLVRDTLKKMSIDLETIGKQRKQMNTADLQHRFGDSPVFDSDKLDAMIQAGLTRLRSFQRDDGGWGWWRDDDSSPFQTAYVLQGLVAARDAGVKVDGEMLSRGLNFLQNFIQTELRKPRDKQELGSFQEQAYTAYILSIEHRTGSDDLKKWIGDLFEKRGEMNNYGRALLALALHSEKREADAQLTLRNLLQFADRDDSNETAWIRTPQQGWWFWWNNDIETNAWALKAIVTLDPRNDLAPRLVKWLLNNRRSGHYWRSTRDTALVISAMTAYMQASGEAAPDYQLKVSVDGQPMREVKVTRDNFFTFDNHVILRGLQIKPGPHEITIEKTGQGALYYSSILSYFTKEEDVKGAGNEIFVDRKYFKLVPKTESVKVANGGIANTLPAGQQTPPEQTGRTELRAGFDRVPLKTGDEVQSGDQIEVVLTITSKNAYDYLAFEDMKPAGCEPVELRSGGRFAGGLCANLELRDEKVVFFIGLLEQGTHILRYKLRAETPGEFHALPTVGSAMYAPEIRGISDEMRLRVEDK